MCAIVRRAVGMRLCGLGVGASGFDLPREAARRGGPTPPLLLTARPAPSGVVIEQMLCHHHHGASLSLMRDSQRSNSR